MQELVLYPACTSRCVSSLSHHLLCGTTDHGTALRLVLDKA